MTYLYFFITLLFCIHLWLILQIYHGNIGYISTYPSNFLFDNENANLLSLWLSRLLSNLCSSSIFNKESGLLFCKMKRNTKTTINALKVSPSRGSSLSVAINPQRSDVKDLEDYLAETPLHLQMFGKGALSSGDLERLQTFPACLALNFPSWTKAP